VLHKTHPLKALLWSYGANFKETILIVNIVAIQIASQQEIKNVSTRYNSDFMHCYWDKKTQL